MAYYFEIITDTRFNGTKKELQNLDLELKRKLSKMDGVNLRTIKSLYEIDWGKELGKPSKQWRIKYIVSKNTRDYSWNEVMGEINSIGYSPYYKKV